MRGSKAHSVPFSASRLERAGDVGRERDILRFHDGQRAQCGHQRRAVGQRQPFLGRQLHGGQAGGGQRLGAGHALPVEFRLAQADHRQGDVRQRRQVTRRAQRPLDRHDRVHAALQHPQQQGEDLQPDAGVTFGQGVGADQHHGPHDRRLERRADPHRVAHDDVALQVAHLIGRDKAILERAKARRDAVDNPAFGHEFFHCGARPVNFDFRLGAQAQGDFARRCISHSHDVFDGQMFTIQHDVQHLSPCDSLGIRRPSAPQPARARSSAAWRAGAHMR